MFPASVFQSRAAAATDLCLWEASHHFLMLNTPQWQQITPVLQGVMCPSDATNCEDNELLAFPPSPSHCKHSQAGSWGVATPFGIARPASSLSAQEQVLLRASRSRAQQLAQGGIAEESPNRTPIAWFAPWLLNSFWETQANCQAISGEGGIPLTLTVFRDL